MERNIFLIVFCIMLAACSRQNSIVGKWQDNTVLAEFFEDGTYIFTGPYTEKGTWKDHGNGKIVVYSSGMSLNGSYKIKDKVLALSFENGDKYELTYYSGMDNNENSQGNEIPEQSMDIEEQLGKMLDAFDEDSSNEDLFRILMLMSEYKNLNDINENKQLENNSFE